MQVRMGVVLMTVIAMSLSAGCANQQQQAQRQSSEEQAQARREQAEAKRQQKLEAEQARGEQKRQAAEDKRRRDGDRRLAEQRRRDEAKYEKEQRDAFASDVFRDERHERALDRFVQSKAAAGAYRDSMLSDAHFDNGELNSLGRSKVALIARGARDGEAVVVYVGGESEEAARGRIEAVQSYAKSTHGSLELEVKQGMNEAGYSPASVGLRGLQKMEQAKWSNGSMTGTSGRGSAGTQAQ